MVQHYLVKGVIVLQQFLVRRVGEFLERIVSRHEHGKRADALQYGEYVCPVQCLGHDGA